MNENEVLFRWDEISPRNIVEDWVRNWWVMVLAGISALFLISGYLNLIYTPAYTSTSTLVISAKGSGSNGYYASLTTASEMADVFSDVFSSSVLKKHIIERLDPSIGDFSITASTIPETNLLVVSATAGTPKVAYQVLTEAIENYTEVSEYVFSNAVLDVLESPSVPLGVSNYASIGDYEKLSAIVGAFAAACAIAIASVLRDTIKTETGAKRKLQGTFLALIGHEEKNKTVKTKLQRAQKTILITNPLVSFGYVETIRKLAFRVQYEMDKKKQKVLMISSVGENEGKSTVAANVALALAENGKKVILVDLDLRRPAIYKIFDKQRNNKKGFWTDHVDIKGEHSLNLFLNDHPVGKPVVFMKHMKEHHMIGELRDYADYVIIDSSPMNVASDAELMASFADTSLLVVRQDWTYTKEINYYANVLQQSPVDFMGYVLNDFGKAWPIGSKQYDYGYSKKYGRYGYGEYNHRNSGD